MQPKRMKRKGLTLLEVIISIAVYAVLALLLAEIMTLVNKTIRSTEQLNNRLSYEAKYADNLMTADEDGAFDTQKVNVKIQYDVTGKENASGAAPSPGEQVAKVKSNKTLDAFNGSPLKSDEYTAHYNETSLGTHFHDNTNYRFMRFDKTNLDKSKPADMFSLRLWFDVSESVWNQIDGIVAHGNFASGGLTAQELEKSSLRLDAPNGWYYIDLQMDASATKNPDGTPNEGTVTDTITVTFHRPTTNASSDGHTIDLKPDQVFDEFTLTYPLSQKQGSETNYYEGYNIVYTGSGIRTPSELTDEERAAHGNIPKEMVIKY